MSRLDQLRRTHPKLVDDVSRKLAKRHAATDLGIVRAVERELDERRWRDPDFHRVPASRSGFRSSAPGGRRLIVIAPNSPELEHDDDDEDDETQEDTMPTKKPRTNPQPEPQPNPIEPKLDETCAGIARAAFDTAQRYADAAQAQAIHNGTVKS